MNWMIKFIFGLIINKDLRTKTKELYFWDRRNFNIPVPIFIKRHMFLKNNLENVTWIETGTYLGDGTIILSNIARHVHSIEPSIPLHETAKKRLSQLTNVTLYNGTSESILPEILNKLQGNVCFWLDGHYSGVGTYGDERESDSPILFELDCIAKYAHKLEKIHILIDDARCFFWDTDDKYPEIEQLFRWAETNGFNIKIEHDVVVMRKK